MYNLDYVPILSLIFIIYEVFKLIFIKSYWENHLLRKKFSAIKIIEVLYAIFIVSLFFHSGSWLFGLLIVLFTFIVASKISEDVMRKHEISFRNRVWLIIDGASSIILLGIVIIQEFLIKH